MAAGSVVWAGWEVSGMGLYARHHGMSCCPGGCGGESGSDPADDAQQNAHWAPRNDGSGRLETGRAKGIGEGMWKSWGS